MSHSIQRAAVDVVLAEERMAGREVREIRDVAQERVHGCDLLVVSDDDRTPVEVKGWGEPLLGATGRFRHHQDVRESQVQAARDHAGYRLEIVANLTAHLASGEPYERLSLTRDHVVAAKPQIHWINLDALDLAASIRTAGGQ